jgi:hypothetical protein
MTLDHYSWFLGVVWGVSVLYVYAYWAMRHDGV